MGVCEAGQKFSDAFSQNDDVLGQLQWYLMPIEIQKMLPPVIINTQKPIDIKFFGTMACNREQFKKVNMSQWMPCCAIAVLCLQNFQVVNAAYKYFMVLREFYK